jgi:hypothetical protein
VQEVSRLACAILQLDACVEVDIFDKLNVITAVQTVRTTPNCATVDKKVPPSHTGASLLEVKDDQSVKLVDHLHIVGDKLLQCIVAFFLPRVVLTREGIT